MVVGSGLPLATGTDILRTLRKQLDTRTRIRCARSLLLLALGAALTQVTPRLIGIVVDGAAAHDSHTCVLGSIALLAAGGAGAIVTRAGTSGLVSATERILARLRADVVRHVLRLQAAVADAAADGDLTMRVVGDPAVISDALRTGLPATVTAGLIVVFTVAGLLTLGWYFVLIAVVSAAIYVLATRTYLRYAQAAFREQQESQGDLLHEMIQSSRGARTAYAYGVGSWRQAVVSDRADRAVDSQSRVIRVRTRFWGQMHLAEIAGVGLSLTVGFFLVRDGRLTIGEATAAALYFTSLFQPVNQFLVSIDTAQEAYASAARMVGLLALPVDDIVAPPTRPATGAIELRDVSYVYGENPRPAVDHLTLRVEPGECVAIVGGSGAGKSTVGKLVAGVFEPTEGKVLVGGAAGNQQVYLVTQEHHVFSGSIADNVRLARNTASDADVLAAFAAVGAAEWVASLPSGPQTHVGVDGEHLEPQEIELIALARLMLADPGVVVLDEPSSEMPADRAQQIDAVIAAAVKNRTAIVIAHRLPQAADAGRIVVLDRGRLVETGSHAGLRSGTTVYAELWEEWQRSRSLPHGTTDATGRE